ncbi:MAG: hypothetical protein JF616_09550 [Fibrobacteres bacterium]|jgi:hypothetical protein|nr:hypothetical protein [Fibrobacterota bacterium]
MAFGSAILLFIVLAAATFHPSARVFYARNPAFSGMLLTLCACFLGVYGALEFSRSEERQDRMARAATLMDMAKDALTADGAQVHLSQFKFDSLFDADIAGAHAGADGKTVQDSGTEARSGGMKPVSASPQELGELLNNGAVLEQISPQSLKALLSSQAVMQRELRDLAARRGRDRRYHLNGYLRELVFAQGVLAAESEFQRGHIGRDDLEEILRDWSLKKAARPI